MTVVALDLLLVSKPAKPITSATFLLNLKPNSQPRLSLISSLKSWWHLLLRHHLATAKTTFKWPCWIVFLLDNLFISSSAFVCVVIQLFHNIQNREGQFASWPVYKGENKKTKRINIKLKNNWWDIFCPLMRLYLFV